MPSSVGASMVPDEKQTRSGGALTRLDLSAVDVAPIPKVGDRLLTGQIVRGSVPRSISEPASHSDEFLAEERVRQKNKKEIEAKAEERAQLAKKTGDIS